MQKPHIVDYMFKHILSGKSMRNVHTLHQEIILFRYENCENGQFGLPLGYLPLCSSKQVV